MVRAVRAKIFVSFALSSCAEFALFAPLVGECVALKLESDKTRISRLTLKLLLGFNHFNPGTASCMENQERLFSIYLSNMMLNFPTKSLHDLVVSFIVSEGLERWPKPISNL